MIKFDKIVYSVWVGGGEVNDHYITDYRTAQELADEYLSEGYDDVEITFQWQPHD